MKRSSRLLQVALVTLALCSGIARAQDVQPLIGARVDMMAVLRDADGQSHAVADLLTPEGTLLLPGYHRCTNICGILQQELAETLSDMQPPPRVLFTSLDPTETPADAAQMRDKLQQAVPDVDLSNWRFLTGEAEALTALTAPLRMQTYVRPGGEVLVHPVATAVLTPEGALSEVFFGFDFTAAALRSALSDAARGKVGGLRERIVLLCSGIDQAVGRIARTALGSLRIAGVAMLILIAAGVFLMLRRERR